MSSQPLLLHRYRTTPFFAGAAGLAQEHAAEANAAAAASWDRLKPTVLGKAREYVRQAAMPAGRGELARLAALLREMSGAPAGPPGSDAAAMLARLGRVASAFSSAVEKQLGPAFNEAPTEQQRAQFDPLRLWREAVAAMINTFINGEGALKSTDARV